MSAFLFIILFNLKEGGGDVKKSKLPSFHDPVPRPVQIRLGVLSYRHHHLHLCIYVLSLIYTNHSI